MKQVEDISGQKWNHLTAIKFIKRDEKSHQIWLWECDCPEKIRKKIKLGQVKYGGTKSCGCCSRDAYGLSRSRIYRILVGMKGRCYNKNNDRYKSYGGRGIIVCKEWKENFKLFYNWAIKNGYQDNLTIDRIDNNGNYCPENCRWATIKEQGEHKRTSHYIEYNGKKQTISQWSEKLKIKRTTLCSRLRLGWTIEEIINNSVELKFRNQNSKKI